MSLLEIIGIESMFVEWVNEWMSGQLLDAFQKGLLALERHAIVPFSL